MNKIFKRFGAFLVAFSLCLCASTTAFAAEVEPEVTEEVVCSEDVGVMPANLNSTLLYADRTSSFITSLPEPFRITTKIDIWDVLFQVWVVGNPGATYQVRINYPDGRNYYGEVTGNSQVKTPISGGFAPAGEYKFYFTRKSGNATSAIGYMEIYD